MTKPSALTLVVCVVAGVAIGMCLATVKVASEPPTFRSLGKLVRAGRGPAAWEPSELDDMRLVIAAIESAELQQKAANRVEAIHSVATGGVRIQCMQTARSSILNILSSGPEPKAAQFFLNAVMDEFIARDLEARVKGDASQPPIAIQERATVAYMVEPEWRAPMLFHGGVGALGGLAAMMLVSAVAQTFRPRKTE